MLKIIAGVLTRNISLSTLKELLKAVTVADKLQKHYESFPEDISAYEACKLSLIHIFTAEEMKKMTGGIELPPGLL